MTSNNPLLRIIGSIWRGLDRLRRLLHLLMLLVLVALFSVLVIPEPVLVPDSAALIIAPSGRIVDQLSGDPVDRALAELQGNGQQETLLRDLIDAIGYAAEDDRIGALYLNFDSMQNAGLSKLQELTREIDEFKRTGKRVIAVGNSFSRDQYYAASVADEVYMHPMGLVLIEGYGRFITYFKSALDSLDVDFHVWSAGEYKSFTEPYTRDDMSPEDREASLAYLGSLWDAYQADVTRRRGLEADSLANIARQYVELLRRSGGDTAEMAVEYGLVDGLLTDAEVNDVLLDVVGPNEERPDRFSAIDMGSYLRSIRTGAPDSNEGERVAVLTLSGTIYDGVEPPGSIGGDSAARMIRQLRRDEDIKALVLRVDSPGGSAFASDVILDEIKAFKTDGRPVVVSMGSVAASGGYWISMAADEIWASATTVTGSIGVGALLPTIPRTLDRIGVHVDGVGTTPLAGQFSVSGGIGPDADSLYGQTVQHLYSVFVDQVAEHRGRTFDEIDAVARGRVWSGSAAHEFGLVDELGDLGDAIASAAGLAGLPPEGYAVDYVEQELDFAEAVALKLTDISAPLLDLFRIEFPWAADIGAVVAAAGEPLTFLRRADDPRGLYAFCFCTTK